MQLVGMVIENTIKVGDFLTAASVSIAVLSLAIASLRDRRLKRKEYADRIRSAAAVTAVAVERWGEVALRFYDDIQPLIVDADMLLLEKGDAINTRDFFYRGLVAARATTTLRILEEKLDSAYVGLYGYAPDIQRLYTSVMVSLRQADEKAYNELLLETQEAILYLKKLKPYTSACLGNPVRGVVGSVQESFAITVAEIVRAFRQQMLTLINASDHQILKKTFPEITPTL